MHCGRPLLMEHTHNSLTATIESVSELLEKRAAAYPVRGRDYDLAMKAIGDLGSHLLRTTDFSSFTPNPALIAAAETLSQKPIFIGGPMKSGTSLLLQLLDGHPDLFVMPGDSHFAKHAKQSNAFGFDHLAAYWLTRFITPTGQKPFWFLGKDEQHLRTFVQYLHYFHSKTASIPPLCAVLAAYVTLNAGGAPPRPSSYWVEKTPGNELNTAFLAARFPSASFVSIVRHPLENISSLLRLSNVRGWQDSAPAEAYYLRRLFRAYRRNAARFPRHFLIKYEDLVSEPGTTMTGLATGLGICSSESLLAPTQGGSGAKSNSMYQDARVVGKILNQSTSTRHRTVLSERDIADISLILSEDAGVFGYSFNRDGVSDTPFGSAVRRITLFLRMFRQRFIRPRVVRSIIGGIRSNRERKRHFYESCD